LVIVLAVLAAGCDRPPDQAAPSVPQAWMGRWTGPEGTWLEIGEVAGNYTVTIMNLDGARTFPGTAEAQGLSFERDGKRETLSATDGAGTGMKWLADKSKCIKVKTGEGFCRD
jgi:hypothetical protein